MFLLVLPSEVVSRFWAKVEKSDECWEWKASISSTGYGQFQCVVEGRRRPWLAHRISWALENGRWPSPDEFVCHRCDNRKCVKPDHLFLGDHQANMTDMVDKDRWDATGERPVISGGAHYYRLRPEEIRKGEEIGTHKLTEEDVIRMRELFGTGEWTGPMLADEFKVSVSTVKRTVRGQTWRHLPLGRMPPHEKLLSLRGRRIWETRTANGTRNYRR